MGERQEGRSQNCNGCFLTFVFCLVFTSLPLKIFSCHASRITNYGVFGVKHGR
jgi:hypothetical protein